MREVISPIINLSSPCVPTFMPYPNSEDNREGVATISLIALLVPEIKAGTSATGKRIVGSRSVALLKYR